MAVPIEKLYDNPAVLHSNDTLAQVNLLNKNLNMPKVVWIDIDKKYTFLHMGQFPQDGENVSFVSKKK